MKSNKETYVNFILDSMIGGVISYNENLSLFCAKFHLTTRSFANYWKVAQERYSDYSEALKNARAATGIGMEVEAVKSKIKSKHERVMILQDQVDGLLKDLYEDIGLETAFIEFIPTEYERPLRINEKIALRKAIKEIQAEISRLEGDYIEEKETSSDKLTINIHNHPLVSDQIE